MTTPKISKGTVTLDGQLYKAFYNEFSRDWYIVQGATCNGTIVARMIKASSARKALQQWLDNKEERR